MDIYNTYSGKAYRFISIDGLQETIVSKSLRFVRADQFNDPLDCSAFIAPYPWNRWRIAGSEFLEHAKVVTFEKVFKSMYVCCFTKTYNSPSSYLMWSHYAKKHTQVCFEIDFSLDKYLGGPSTVEYPSNLVSARDCLKPSDNVGLFLLTTKFKVWEYENEVRLIID